MSNLFNKLSQEATQQREQLASPTPSANPHDTESHSDATTSPTDVTTSPTENTEGAKPRRGKQKSKPTPPTSSTPKATAKAESKLDKKLLKRIVTELGVLKTTAHGTPVRLSDQEKEFFEDFILVTLRKAGIQLRQVSLSKLMRYALTYLLLKHPDEFTQVLKESLIQEGDSSLFM